MSRDLPKTSSELMAWTWPRIEPHYAQLRKRTLTEHTVGAWLQDWSDLTEHVYEMGERLYVATTVNTADPEADARFASFLTEIREPAAAAEQVLKQMLLDSGLQPSGLAVPLRNMRSEAEIFRQENLPLLTEQNKLANEYDKIVGAQTVNWDNQEITLTQLRPVYKEPDRSRREEAWRAAGARRLADRAAINELWERLLRLRRRIAANAGFGDDYRAYRWKEMLRFDYTPADCYAFHDAIERVVVPAATRIYERRCKRLGLSSLRPWDLDVDPFGRPALHPFGSTSELESGVAEIFQRVDPVLGAYFDTMRAEGLLDLENRKNKAPGGYCDEFAVVKRPFIFANAVGLHEDVQTLLHEGGHAFHCFETAALPYLQQRNVGMEFAEVASMGMELLAAPYLDQKSGGFYSPGDAARARVEHLEEIILFWPYMAIVDAFQHWVYEHPDAALVADNCDATWRQLWRRFTPGVDYSGLEEYEATGWHNKLHIHQIPFYYVEYGLAQLGATQVWANALKDQRAAVAAYRRGLALGGTVTLPELYSTAGAHFAFDAGTLSEAVALSEQMIAVLEGE